MHVAKTFVFRFDRLHRWIDDKEAIGTTDAEVMYNYCINKTMKAVWLGDLSVKQGQPKSGKALVKKYLKNNKNEKPEMLIKELDYWCSYMYPHEAETQIKLEQVF